MQYTVCNEQPSPNGIHMTLERILVRLPGAKLGDFLMTTPALAGLRRAHPRAQITLLLWSRTPGPWLQGHPLFDATLWDDEAEQYGGARGAIRLLAELRNRRFDATVTLHRGSRYAWLFRLAKIPYRIGSTDKAYGRFYTHNLKQNRDAPDRHEVEYNYDMMRVLGVEGDPGPMVSPVTSEDAAQAGRLLAGRRREDVPLVLINPTHGGSSRTWPADRFVLAAREIAAARPVQFAFIGVDADREHNRPLAKALGPETLDLTGETTVGELGAVLQRSALHISIDTGTAHLAAAMGTPCVTLFPFSEHWDQRVRWRPWQTETRILGPTLHCDSCRPYCCSRSQTACVESITPHAVVCACLELLTR